jgi:hypothetical protein
MLGMRSAMPLKPAWLLERTGFEPPSPLRAPLPLLPLKANMQSDSLRLNVLLAY